MTDETVIDRDDEIIEEKVADTPDDPKDILRQAREMIPVGRTGVAPINFAQQVDFARDMAKARVSIPQHLKGSVGDCLAVVDIATRAGLSPYMVANKTYVQAGRLSFESQLYHAFAQASGLLKGDLNVEYENTGDDLVCIVTGYLRADPFTPRTHRSEPLIKAHPGHVQKDGKTFVKGSPLWDRKPKVQLFYDTSRDWVRIYCPRATLGIFTPDEIEEYGPEFARDVSAAGLHDRLTGSERGAEGHQDGHAERELDQIAGRGQIIEHDPPAGPDSSAGAVPVDDAAADHADHTPTPNKRTTGRPRGSSNRTKGEKPPKKADLPARTETLTPSKLLPSKAEVKRIADRAEEKSAAARLSDEVEDAIKSVKTAKQYLAYAKKWIAACDDSTELFVRWTAERKFRNATGVTADDREPLDKLIAQRREELEG